MQASLIDFSFAAIDSKTRNLTFAFVLELERSITGEELLHGAADAFATHPRSNCRLSGYDWVPVEKPFALDQHETIESYMETYLNPREERGVGLCLVNEKTLVAKFHHALCDGVGAMLWLRTLLDRKREAPVELQLKTSQQRAMKSKFATAKKASQPNKASAKRRWMSIDLEKPSSTFSDHTYNDLLCASIMETMTRLQRTPASLYIPVNIRQEPFVGFGNGTSRIKIYGSDTHTISDASRDVRKQVRWCKEQGLWSSPDLLPALRRLPVWTSTLMLRGLARHPGADFCSMLFSHIEKVIELPHVRSYEVIAPLIPQYQMSIVGVGQGEKTRLTITWDSQQLDEDEVREFAEHIERSLHSI